MAVVSVLSEREQRVLAAAEAMLLEHDEVLVRSFDALARNDGGGGPAAVAAPMPSGAAPGHPVPGARERRRRARPTRDGLLRALYVLTLLAIITVAGCILAVGDGPARLLAALVIVPVLGFTVLTAVVHAHRGRRGGR